MICRCLYDISWEKNHCICPGRRNYSPLNKHNTNYKHQHISGCRRCMKILKTVLKSSWHPDSKTVFKFFIWRLQPELFLESFRIATALQSRVTHLQFRHAVGHIVPIHFDFVLNRKIGSKTVGLGFCGSFRATMLRGIGSKGLLLNKHLYNIFPTNRQYSIRARPASSQWVVARPN